MSIWTSIFGQGVGEVLKPISDILDHSITNKEEKARLENELRKIIFDHEAKIQEEIAKRETALLADVASARAMNMKGMDNQDKFIRRFTYYLAAGVLLAIFGLFLFIIQGQVNIENEAIVYTILGSLTTSSTAVLAFFFGSTRGADNKNETIKNLSVK